MRLRLLQFRECNSDLIGKEIYLGVYSGVSYITASEHFSRKIVQAVDNGYVQTRLTFTDRSEILLGSNNWGCGARLPFVPLQENARIQAMLVPFDALPGLRGRNVFIEGTAGVVKRVALNFPKDWFVKDTEFSHIEKSGEAWARLHFGNGKKFFSSRKDYESDQYAHRIYIPEKLVVKVDAMDIEALKKAMAEPILDLSLATRIDSGMADAIRRAESELLPIPIVLKMDDGAKEPQKETKMNTQDTLKSIADLLVEGVRIHSSAEASNRIVGIIKKQLGESYPKFFETDIGKALEPMLLPALVYFGTSYFTGNEMAKKVRNISSYALMGSAGSLGDYATKLMPVFNEIAALAPLMEDLPEFKKQSR